MDHKEKSEIWIYDNLDGSELRNILKAWQPKRMKIGIIVTTDCSVGVNNVGRDVNLVETNEFSHRTVTCCTIPSESQVIGQGFVRVDLIGPLKNQLIKEVLSYQWIAMVDRDMSIHKNMNTADATKQSLDVGITNANSNREEFHELDREKLKFRHVNRIRHEKAQASDFDSEIFMLLFGSYSNHFFQHRHNLVVNVASSAKF